MFFSLILTRVVSLTFMYVRVCTLAPGSHVHTDTRRKLTPLQAARRATASGASTMKSIPEEVLRAALEGAVRGGGSMAACRAFFSLIGAVFTGRLFKKPQEAIKELVRKGGSVQKKGGCGG